VIDEEIRSNLAFNSRGDAEPCTGFSLEELNQDTAKAVNTKADLISPSKKITKNKESLRLVNKKPSKKSRN